MVDPVLSVDIEDAGLRLDELADLVAVSREARILRRGGCFLAVILPLAPTRADEETRKMAFKRSAGAWKDVDVDALKRRIREERDAGTPLPRP